MAGRTVREEDRREYTVRALLTRAEFDATHVYFPSSDPLSSWLRQALRRELKRRGWVEPEAPRRDGKNGAAAQPPAEEGGDHGQAHDPEAV